MLFARLSHRVAKLRPPSGVAEQMVLLATLFATVAALVAEAPPRRSDTAAPPDCGAVLRAL